MAVVITGAAGGIGSAIARAFDPRVQSLVLVDHPSAREGLQALALGLGQGRVLARSLDVSDPGACADLVAGLEEPATVLVNCAGITRDRTLLKMGLGEWDQVLKVNLYGPFYLSRAVLPAMVAAGWGRIINIASVIGQTGGYGQCNYAASKGGLIAFSKSLALEVAKHNITVNAVAPGFVNTPMVAQMPEAVLNLVLRTVPMGRLARPEEVAALVAYLASEEAGFITGQTIGINGGLYR